MKVLECSSKGDKRYSAFYARVSVFGVTDTIENHYQMSKRIGDFVPATVKDIKGKRPTHFVVGKYTFDIKYLTAWYNLLWTKYLDCNPDLVAYANQFDDFNDMFKGRRTVNCQADVIRSYIKKGRESMYLECAEFISLFN